MQPPCCLLTTIGVKPSSSKKQIQFSPNPTNGFLNVKEIHTVEEIQFFDVAGKLVRAESSFNGNEIDISMLKQGLYLLKVSLKNGELVIKKVIKQ
jgi:hypothetical protein|tara:strand:+ start:837 stop:1121 length:285 start_codon:yes stop_codon:yes gene_type:complete